MCEFSINRGSPMVVLDSRIFWCFKVSLAAYRSAPKLCYPEILLGPETDTFIPGLVVGRAASIHAVLLWSRSAQIMAPIIESVAVYMITKFSPGETKNGAVHIDEYALTIVVGFGPDRIEFTWTGFKRRPFPLAEPLKVGMVNFGVFALGEQGFAV